MDMMAMSAFSVLSGTVIGSIATVASGWLAQAAQSRAGRAGATLGRRAELYGRFLEEASRLSAVAHDGAGRDLAMLRAAFVRISLEGSDDVVTRAGQLVARLEQGADPTDELAALTASCRRELGARRRR